MTEAALQAAFEEGERGDWAAYVLRQATGSRLVDLRPRLARLAAGLPGVGLRAQVLAIDAEPRVSMLAARAERLLERGFESYHLLVELFARKEELARKAGFAGYAQLCIAADGLTPEVVEEELELADTAIEPAPPASMDTAEVLERLPPPEGVEVRFEPFALVGGMTKVLRWPDHIGVVVRDRTDVHTLAHELGHALQCRERAAAGLGFLDWFTLGAVDAETAAFAAERELFGRPAFEREWLARARFELGAYAAAHDGVLAPGAWSRERHGFWTEDPMRSYAYPLAYVRSSAASRRA